MLRRAFYNTAFPRHELNQLRRAARALETPKRVASTFPAMNIWINDDNTMVTARVPGVNLEDVDISVKADTVTVAGVRNPVELGDAETFLRRERRYGKFSRTFQLPFTVEADAVEATFEKGILQITLTRAEADKPKKIAVTAA